jgi:hypothetical protein
MFVTWLSQTVGVLITTCLSFYPILFGHRFTSMYINCKGATLCETLNIKGVNGCLPKPEICEFLTWLELKVPSKLLRCGDIFPKRCGEIIFHLGQKVVRRWWQMGFLWNLVFLMHFTWFFHLLTKCLMVIYYVPNLFHKFPLVIRIISYVLPKLSCTLCRLLKRED